MEKAKKGQNKPQQPLQKHSQNLPDDKKSMAPYNFVPLNEEVVFAEQIPDFDRYYKDRYTTGYIDLEIKTLTPLYIRDTLTEEEYKKKIEHEKSKKDDKQQCINPDFYGPGGLIRIPGSSLRGMIRTMVEIVSYGKFGFFDDRRLYYRSFADKCKKFRQEYQECIKNTQVKNMQAGVMIKKGLKYYIIPTSYEKVEKDLTPELIGEKPEEFHFYPVRYKNRDGYIIVSGFMNNKNVDWFIEKPKNYSNENHLSLSDDDVKDYKDDKERKAKINLIAELNKNEGVPCFFTEYNDMQGKKRIAFGHTKNFRLPYKRTIGDHIPGELKTGSIDIPEAIFGNEKSHATRVFFEDAYLVEGQKDVLMDAATPKILSTPKPTTFQHYIKQYPRNLNNFPNDLAHYNSSNLISGYKLYWHREADDEWKETNKENIEKHKKQYTQITPVKAKTTFKSRIRFENLSKVELGALLFALDLPDGCAHKLGMGKPLGLGSVRIKPTLYLSNRFERYKDLFSDWKGIAPADDARINEFKQKFERLVFSKIGNPSLPTLWDTERMKELKRMLDYDGKPAKDKTRYLELREFRARKILPKPTEVK